MSNTYFDWPATADRFIRFDTVRSADLNDALDAVSAGFDEVAADIAAGVAAAVSSTSVSSVAIGVGSKSFACSSARSWAVGQWLIAASSASPTNFMVGQVTAYNATSGALTISVAVGDAVGSGTFASWNIGLVGKTGAAAPGGIVLLDTKTGAASSYDFASYITSTYDEYVFRLINVVPSAGAIPWVRSSTNAGVSFDSGASDYGSVGNIAAPSPAITAFGSTGAAQFALSDSNVSSTASHGGLNGTLTLIAPSGTTQQKVMNFEGHQASTGTTHYKVAAAGVRLSTADIDAMRFMFSGGATIASGTIRMYGVNKT